ncbi:GH116 family glycosyl hydrolase, partial [Pontiella sp.]|uniref:GH116 family glycosyl hydrolase n=1 Tax=Pontiella sp. TaxID=2837462 RepID=UPI0035618F82
VLLTLAPGASASAEWDSPKSLYGDVTASGALKGPSKSKVSPAGQSVNGALSVPLELAPGETKSVTYALTWYFKSTKHGSGKRSKAMEGEPASGPWSHSGQKYTTWWADAMGVADYLTENLDELTARTHLYHDTLYASNLPRWLLDRMSSPLAVLRSQTCWWAADDYFGAWEGCRSNAGSCGGNCTHVWQYAQGHARLFPELGRLMRHQDFAQQKPTGLFPNRHGGGEAAADGFFGTILNTYREHLCSTDDAWVKEKWPGVKKAMEFGMEEWDPNHDGYLQNRQHNTLDGKMWGCSSWIGSLYLSALEAAARIADIAGDPQTAAEYRKIRASGQKMQNERLWNGEYYIQEVGVKREQDYLDGCHIDQLLGDWWAGQVGIELSFPQDRSRSAMEALLNYNFYTDFHGQSLKPRQYFETDDGGMKMITWPKNPQPIPGMKYGDEVMTGFEYAAAATMIQNGLQNEGLMAIKTIYDRYDGRLRTEGVTDLDVAAWGYSGNPFGDDECGKFYGRSLSSWSALLVLQGFVYDGPAGRIGFRPRWQPENHASFFTAAEGYGLFSQTLDANTLAASIDLKAGQLRLTEVVLSLPEGKRAKSAQATLAGKPVAARFDSKGADVTLLLKSPLVLKAGQRLDFQVAAE